MIRCLSKRILLAERLDKIAGWLLVAIGLVHCVMTPRVYPTFGEPALWFLSAGLTLLYAGAFNLLRIAYSAVAPGLRRVCILVNLSLCGFTFAFAGRKIAKTLRDPASWLLLILVVGATCFSILRRPAVREKLASRS